MDGSRNTVTDLSNEAMPLRVAHLPCDHPDVVANLAQQLGNDPLSLVLLFFSPQTNLSQVLAGLDQIFGDTPIIGCTTAGELTRNGYEDGQIIAIGLPKPLFRCQMHLIPDLTQYDSDLLVQQMIESRGQLRQSAPDFRHEFNFLLIDGLSRHEDTLTAALSLGLGPGPLFGGSAGDGTSFDQTFVLWQGQLLRNAAIVTQIRSRCPVRVFKTDHLIPNGQKMVVTAAKPERRRVQEINAEPAAREYARLLGKDSEHLDSFTFAAHPVVVQIGDQHHVRSIQRVAENGDLVFFSAIDEGVVLTLADAQNMAEHLRQQMEALSHEEAPAAILACDCLLRKVEAEQKQMISTLSSIMRQHNVVGFSTYGEQLNSMHVNQTMTGVAIYPPERIAPQGGDSTQ